jgi:hypothetical protein
MLSGSPVIRNRHPWLSNRNTEPTSKRVDVCLDPLQCKPLVLESVISVQFWLMRRKKSEYGKSMAGIDPDFRHLSADILRTEDHAENRIEEIWSSYVMRTSDGNEKALTLRGSKLLRETFAE